MVKKIRTYSTEFKAEAVKKISDNNGNISATAKQLGIAMRTLSNWYNKANQGKLKGTEQYDPELIAVLEENKRLRRQLKIVEEEREILKKATAYYRLNEWQRQLFRQRAHRKLLGHIEERASVSPRL